MIFVTVGAQMPFDRLVKTVDQWARDNDRKDVFAQIGPTEYRPSHIQWAISLPPLDFKEHCGAARVIISHAGTGSIITALQLGKPILVMPRQASLRETRNDHQVGTAEHFRCFESVEVAWNEDDLITHLEHIDRLTGRQPIAPYASPELVEAVRAFIENTPFALSSRDQKTPG